MNVFERFFQNQRQYVIVIVHEDKRIIIERNYQGGCYGQYDK